MKKILYILLALIIALTTGCSSEKPDATGAYETVIDMLYREDEALNSGIKYMAVDTTTMNNLTEDGKKVLLKNLEKYGLVVLDMTYEELKEKGYIEETNFKEGILFKIEDEVMKSNSITMNVSKFRSGLGAIGYDNLKVKYRAGEWKVTDKKTAWIS